MAAEDHPQYREWSEALDHLVAAERRYYTAVMEGQSEDDLQPAARELDEAREKYHTVADKIG